jgi:hypothetical protein
MQQIDLTTNDGRDRGHGGQEEAQTTIAHLTAARQASQQRIESLQEELRSEKAVLKDVEERLQEATQEANRQPKRQKVSPPVTSSSSSSSSTDAWKGKFEWTPMVHELLQQRFGYSRSKDTNISKTYTPNFYCDDHYHHSHENLPRSFREKQEEVINATLAVSVLFPALSHPGRSHTPPPLYRVTTALW